MVWRVINRRPASTRLAQPAAEWEFAGPLKHDPEKWKPVFGKDHAQTKR
jgi:hypothetical protein